MPSLSPRSSSGARSVGSPRLPCGLRLLRVPRSTGDGSGRSPDRPSILLIVTDDQRWDTLWAMPEVQRSLVERGRHLRGVVHHELALLPEPGVDPDRCVPAHDGGVPPGLAATAASGRSTTRRRSRRSSHDAGYRTGFFGKYLDSYQHDALTGYVPPGWDRWVAFVHSQFFDYGLTVDGIVHRRGHEPDDYSTDVLAAHTEGFIRGDRRARVRRLRSGGAPCPRAPGPGRRGGGSTICPRGGLPPSTRSDRSDKPDIHPGSPPGRRRSGPRPSRSCGATNTGRCRRSIERSGDLLDALEDTGRLDDALVIFTSDNGLLWGEHRWLKKEVPVRGGDPGPAGRSGGRDRRRGRADRRPPRRQHRPGADDRGGGRRGAPRRGRARACFRCSRERRRRGATRC